MRRTSIIAGCAIAALHVLQDIALACPTCYGDPSSSEVQGMKWAILSLLGITGTVLFGLSVLFLYLRKRAIELNRRFSDKLN